MNTIKAVLFDLDGTLLDSAPDFHFVINLMLQKRARPLLTLDELHHQVSNGARAMVRYAFSDAIDDAQFEALKAEFLALYLKHLNEASQLYSGINELLDFLDSKNILWGVVTNKPELYTLPIIEHFKLSTRSACVICPDHVTHTKPHPEPLFLACKQMNIDPENCWYVGDHIRDIEAGKAAGMLTIGCNYGYLNADDDSTQWDAEYLVNNPMHILNHLQQHIT